MDVSVQVRLPSAEEIASRHGSDDDEWLSELERIDRMLQAAKLGVIDHADREARFLADGHRSSAAWTRAVTNCSPADSRRRVRAARALRDLPYFREALQEGSVGVDQVHEVARLHANPRCGNQVAGASTSRVSCVASRNSRARNGERRESGRAIPWRRIHGARLLRTPLRLDLVSRAIRNYYPWRTLCVRS